MNFEIAKTFIDNLFQNKYSFIDINDGIVLDFIGGEPLMEIELIEKIVDYYFE
jgi:sulfatase maturation enzyme AslB (radical SAM superfamily)